MVLSDLEMTNVGYTYKTHIFFDIKKNLGILVTKVFQ